MWLQFRFLLIKTSSLLNRRRRRRCRRCRRLLVHRSCQFVQKSNRTNLYRAIKIFQRRYRLLETVRPDVELKSSPSFPKVAQKGASVVFF